jgi:hypothetical protein
MERKHQQARVEWKKTSAGRVLYAPSGDGVIKKLCTKKEH